MPTGYTAKLVENGQTFEKFVWTCARAFGALIEMRDDDLDAPIPDTLAESSYYTDSLAKARSELSRLNLMSEAERLAYGEKVKRDNVDACRESLASHVAENARITAMLARVKQWTPPTTDHAKLKEFMVEQLTISMHDVGFSEDWLKKATQRSPLDYFKAAQERAVEGVADYPKEIAKERDRTKARNDWLAALRRSVPPPTIHVRAAGAVAGD